MVEGNQELKSGLRKIYRKSWPWDNLFGSSRFEFNAADRGIWNDLLDFAKISRVKPGVVAPAEGQAYNHAWLSGLLNVTPAEFDHAIEVFSRTKRISENGDGIEIINWKKYQADADRQKEWREKKKKVVDTGDPSRFKGQKYGHLIRGGPDDPDKYVKGPYGHMVQR